VGIVGLTVASTADVTASSSTARRLAASVPKGTQSQRCALPTPRPLRRERYPAQPAPEAQHAAQRGLAHFGVRKC